jgi:hypothetical protein
VLDSRLTDALADWISAQHGPLPALSSSRLSSTVVVARPIVQRPRPAGPATLPGGRRMEYRCRGAVAEYAVSHPVRQIVRADRTVSAPMTTRARLTITDDAAAFAIAGNDATGARCRTRRNAPEPPDLPGRGVSLRSDGAEGKATTAPRSPTPASAGGRRHSAFAAPTMKSSLCGWGRGRDWRGRRNVGSCSPPGRRSRSPSPVGGSGVRVASTGGFSSPDGTHTSAAGDVGTGPDPLSMFAVPPGNPAPRSIRTGLDVLNRSATTGDGCSSSGSAWVQSTLTVAALNGRCVL